MGFANSWTQLTLSLHFFFLKASVKPQTTKLLAENARSMLSDIGHSIIFLDPSL